MNISGQVRKVKSLCSAFLKSLNDRSHSVRLAIGNGTRADVWSEFMKRFGNITIREFYGMTERNCGLINYSGKMGAVGRDTFLNKVKVPVD